MNPGALRILEGADWRLAWTELQGNQRALITSAVGRGKALDEPGLAALAVNYARLRRRRAVWGFALAPIVLIVGILSLRGEGGPLPVLSRVLPAVAPAVVAFALRGVAVRAERANREVVEGAIAESLPPPPKSGTVADVLRAWQRDVGVADLVAREEPD